MPICTTFTIWRLVIGLSQRECPLWSKAYRCAYQFLFKMCESSLLILGGGGGSIDNCCRGDRCWVWSAIDPPNPWSTNEAITVVEAIAVEAIAVETVTVVEVIAVEMIAVEMITVEAITVEMITVEGDHCWGQSVIDPPPHDQQMRQLPQQWLSFPLLHCGYVMMHYG